MKNFIKAPSEILDYSLDYSREFLKINDRITQSSWTVPSNSVNGVGLASISLSDSITVDYVNGTPSYNSGGTVFDDKITTIYLSGGTLNSTYIIENRILTESGRRYTRRFSVTIQNRNA